MDTKRGDKGYKRPTGKILLPEDAEETRPRYELLDHTADLGIRVAADTLEGLFEDAGLALFDLLTDLNRVTPAARFQFSLKAESLEGLLAVAPGAAVQPGKRRCSAARGRGAQKTRSRPCWGERVDPRSTPSAPR
jgi:hypothetical protein